MNTLFYFTCIAIKNLYRNIPDDLRYARKSPALFDNRSPLLD